MDAEKLKKLLKYTIYADKFNYHNQMINFLDKFYEPENFPKKLINFDLHIDLKYNLKCLNNHIANWVNHTFGKYDIEEYYWVLPTNYFQNCKRIKNQINKNQNASNTTQDNSYLLKKTLEFQFSRNRVWNITDKEIEEKYLERKNKNPEDFKTINVYYCTEDYLPDFNKEDVIVSVDADYFSNNGYDTYEDYKYTPKNINEDFEKFVDLLLNKNIYPTYFGLCLSNNYVEDLENNNKFYDEILKNQLCPIKFNINYTYTDLSDDNFTYSDAYIYKSNKTINVFFIADYFTTEKNIIETYKLNEQLNEDGIYQIGYFKKNATDIFNHPTSQLYPHEYTITKHSESSPFFEIMTKRIQEKIQNLKKNQTQK